MSARGSSRPTPVGKQRVRTGCQTCRRRRRKCDERKPRCEACELKGFTCKYGTDLTFVIQNKYVVEAAANKPTASRAAPADTTSNSTISPIGDRTQCNDVNQTHSNPVHLAAPTLVAPSVTLSTAASTYSHAGRDLMPALTYGSLAAPAEPDPDALHETGLLCHYRYNVAQLVDLAGPDAPFGIRVLLEARDKECRPLFAAVLALAAGHKAMLMPQQPVGIGADWGLLRCRYRQEAEVGLQFVDAHAKRVSSSLLLLDDLFVSSPMRWRLLLLNYLSVPGLLPPPSILDDETDEALFWLCFRIDIAASIASGQPPLLPYKAYLRDDGSSIRDATLLTERDPARYAFQHSLLILASALSLAFDPAESIPSSEDYSDAATFAASRPEPLSSRWSSLWVNCQRWYSNRPREAQQILEIRGMDLDLVDPQDSSSFPILVYTTPLALVANAAYHIACLVLLSHKPRLLKPLAGPRCFSSYNWHAQSLAGIAISNESSEHWDPTLIAGLLLAAKDMTHISQQSAVFECLGRITACTGIRLQLEADALKSSWSVAVSNERAMG